MSFMVWLKRVANVDQEVRRSELMAILDEIQAPWLIYEEQLDEREPKNMVVRFSEGDKRWVIGAHYDSFPESTGTNDNGAAVCALVGVVKHLIDNPPSVPLDIVFFDCEEVGQQGSRTYLERFGAESVLGFVNLDMCGLGDTVLVGPESKLADNLLGSAIYELEKTKKYNMQIVERIPPGDEGSFEKLGIPNVSVCMMPSEDVDNFNEILKREKKVMVPKVFATMHNGPLDSIDIIEEGAMEKMCDWVVDLVRSF